MGSHSYRHDVTMNILSSKFTKERIYLYLYLSLSISLSISISIYKVSALKIYEQK